MASHPATPPEPPHTDPSTPVPPAPDPTHQGAPPHRVRRLAADATRLLPEKLRTHSPENRWPAVGLELVLLAVLVAINPHHLTRRETAARWFSFALTGAITVVNTASMVLLATRILTGRLSNDAGALLGGAAAIYLTNVIAFGLWFWELDRGGPFARRNKQQDQCPDFLFPQMTQSGLGPDDWRPLFVDYLYVSFTNSVAFSPTDTMPLSRWAKLLMAVQATVATSTLILVVARAVNVLH